VIFAEGYVAQMYSELRQFVSLARDAALTFLRVNAALVLGALWTVPVGVWIGTSPHVARLAQPLVQIAASIPATAIFPYLVTGMLTASGGAWNASIVAEYFHFQGKALSVRGLGASISRATDSGNLPVLLAATRYKLDA
jgi:ABC-type anion transport system duplicated permease subunit